MLRGRGPVQRRGTRLRRAAVILEVLTTLSEHRTLLVTAIPDLVLQPESAQKPLKGLFAENNLIGVRRFLLPLLRLRAVEVRRGNHAMSGTSGQQVEIPEDAALGVGEEAQKESIGDRRRNENRREIEEAVGAR